MSEASPAQPAPVTGEVVVHLGGEERRFKMHYRAIDEIERTVGDGEGLYTVLARTLGPQFTADPPVLNLSVTRIARILHACLLPIGHKVELGEVADWVLAEGASHMANPVMTLVGYALNGPQHEVLAEGAMPEVSEGEADPPNPAGGLSSLAS